MTYQIHIGFHISRSVDFLDEIEPGSFRQAQVTFSSRLPHVFPVGDAMSMSANVMTYCTNSPLELLHQGNYTEIELQ